MGSSEEGENSNYLRLILSICELDYQSFQYSSAIS
jgi:hypothetical protein